MKQIAQAFQELPLAPIPTLLHQRIMRRVLWRRFRWPLILILSGLAIIIIASGWRLWVHLVDGGVLAMIKESWTDIEFDQMYLTDFWQIIKDYFPVALSIVFLTDLVLGAAFLYLTSSLSRILAKGRLVI